MKKILYIYFMLSMVFITSCDDLLDVTPTDRISESSVWKDQTLVQAYVNTQYRVVETHFGNNLHQYADESYATGGAPWSFRLNSLTPDNSTELSNQLDFWNMAYEYIRNINIFFEKIDASGFDEDVITSMKGEMSFLRAYIYSTLLYSYGGVPIIEKVFELGENMTGIERNSYQEVFDYVMEDLDYVIENMPAKQDADNFGRASADVAWAMKGRLLLYDASAHYNPGNTSTKWQIASDAADSLIQSGRYSLYTGSYNSLFYTAVNNEVIWQKYYAITDRQGYQFNTAAPMLNGYGQSQPTQNLVDAYEMTNGELPYLEDGSLTPTVNPASGFDPDAPYVNRDPRFYTLVAYNLSEFKGTKIYTHKGYVSQDEAKTGYYSFKYINPADPISGTTYYTEPIILYRYAEVLLNYAEAQYELGFEDEARERVNEVRARAGMPEIPVTVTGTALRDKIRNERRVELAYEGHRYFDIRRWEIAEEVSLKPIIGTVITKSGDPKIVNPGDTYTYERVQLLPGFWDDKQYLVPIPYTEIQRSNMSIEQNPGY